jgi:hypothetical protein
LSEIIEHGDHENGRNLTVGEANSPISVKVYQDLYHQITGRTEQIRKRYSDNLLIDFPELEQLHHKVMQLCDVHHVLAHNETISVFHDKERKEQFTSFDRFRAYNANAVSPCVNVVLKYNFAITPAGVQKPQEYVVTIRLTSRVALLEHAEEEAPPFMRGRIINFMSENTAEISVEYADYIIARGFIEAFDEWVRGCNCTAKRKGLYFLRLWSHLIPETLQLSLVVAIAWFALQTVSEFFKQESSPEAWARFLILYSSASYILLSLIERAGRMLEDAIDTYPTLSYLKLNKGDERLIADFQDRRNRTALKFVGGIVLTVVLGILSAKIEKLL